MKLSIIICVYNTERHYLEECLFSIANSTIGVDFDGAGGIEYEICLVDDGSDVDYSDIVRKYGIRYRRKINGGILSARIEGLLMSMGDYICFVDSDDTVSLDFHRQMLREADLSDADIVINDWAFHTDNSRYFTENDSTICTDISLRGEEVLDFFFSKCGREHSAYVVWNKLYKRECISRAIAELARFTDGRRVSYSEDALMNFFIFKEAQTVKNVHTGYYFYRIHSSQSVNAVSREQIRRQVENMAYTFSVMRRTLSEYGYHFMLHGLREWELLMSRTHYSYARAGKHPSLYGFISSSYNTEELRVPLKSDGEAYMRTKLLPENLPDIDAAFLKLISENSKEVSITGSNSYAMKLYEHLKLYDYYLVINGHSKNIIPKEHISLKSKLLHNKAVFKLANRIFKKGSRIRKFLKRWI